MPTRIDSIQSNLNQSPQSQVISIYRYKKTITWDGLNFDVYSFQKEYNTFISQIDFSKPTFTEVDGLPEETDATRNTYTNLSALNFDPSNKQIYFQIVVSSLYTPTFNNYNYAGKASLTVTVSNGSDAVEPFAKHITRSNIGFSEAFNEVFKKIREDITNNSINEIRRVMPSVKIIEGKPFTDPEPQLNGPPTQTISGVKNKPPVVDNPNIKLQSQTEQSLTATSAKEAVSQTTASSVKAVKPNDPISSLTSAQSSITESSDNIKNKAMDKLNPKRIVPDGLGKEWSPDKYSPSSIAGNAVKINPLTGAITGGLTGAAIGAATGAIKGGLKGGVSGALGGAVGGAIGGALGGPIGGAIGGAASGIVSGLVSKSGVGNKLGSNLAKSAAIGAAGGLVAGGIVSLAQSRLDSIKSNMIKPKTPSFPNSPRIKIVNVN